MEAEVRRLAPVAASASSSLADMPLSYRVRDPVVAAAPLAMDSAAAFAGAVHSIISGHTVYSFTTCPDSEFISDS